MYDAWVRGAGYLNIPTFDRTNSHPSQIIHNLKLPSNHFFQLYFCQYIFTFGDIWEKAQIKGARDTGHRIEASITATWSSPSDSCARLALQFIKRNSLLDKWGVNYLEMELFSLLPEELFPTMHLSAKLRLAAALGQRLDFSQPHPCTDTPTQLASKHGPNHQLTAPMLQKNTRPPILVVLKFFFTKLFYSLYLQNHTIPIQYTHWVYTQIGYTENRPDSAIHRKYSSANIAVIMPGHLIWKIHVKQEYLV